MQCYCRYIHTHIQTILFCWLPYKQQHTPFLFGSHLLLLLLISVYSHLFFSPLLLAYSSWKRTRERNVDPHRIIWLSPCPTPHIILHILPKRKISPKWLRTAQCHTAMIRGDVTIHHITLFYFLPGTYHYLKWSYLFINLYVKSQSLNTRIYIYGFKDLYCLVNTWTLGT